MMKMLCTSCFAHHTFLHTFSLSSSISFGYNFLLVLFVSFEYLLFIISNDIVSL